MSWPVFLLLASHHWCRYHHALNFSVVDPITNVDTITLWCLKNGESEWIIHGLVVEKWGELYFLVSSWYQCRRGEVCGGNDSARECFRWCNWFLHCWVDPERIVAFYLSFGFERRSQMRILCSWIDDLKSCDASNIDGLKSGSVNVDPWLFRTYLFPWGLFRMCFFSILFENADSMGSDRIMVF
jgi:hypothetical protein